MNIGNLDIKIRPNSWDKNIVEAIIKNNEYPVEVSPGDKVIDLGGHIGSFSLLCASKGASVTVYEPHPENYKLLLENIKRNGFENKIKAINKAICEGDAKISTSKNNMGSCKLSKEGIDVKGIIPELDCDIIKIDCEGCEYNINIPVVKQLFMELHPGDQNRILMFIRRNYKDVKIMSSNAKNCKIIWARN